MENMLFSLKPVRQDGYRRQTNLARKSNIQIAPRSDSGPYLLCHDGQHFDVDAIKFV